MGSVRENIQGNNFTSKAMTGVKRCSFPYSQNPLALVQTARGVAQERSVVNHRDSAALERAHARLHLLGAQIAPAAVQDEVCVNVCHLVVFSEAVNDTYAVFSE